MVNRRDPDSGSESGYLFDKFSNHQATSIGADGKDIQSVTMRLKTDEAVDEAFAAIESLTDADLAIEDESDDLPKDGKGA
jgi:hypothetical protein